ncbi:unnamed protein product [Rotaria sordida]|uniref:Protein kinase C-binding protein 1 n=1 Tax=Rotaria sordida TaxID=392033 RepID=A0A813X3R1_9BILA|nr:unnamed protein product [Rotaria sordida]
MDLPNNNTSCVKLKKTTDENNHHDIYCFECHHVGDVIRCDSCPRVYHLKCLNLTVLPERNWTCPECEITQSSFYIINQSIPLQHHSINEFHRMLKYALGRLQLHPQSKHFIRSIDYKQMPEYLDYIIHPMDLEIIEKNINLKKYRSTEAFISDIKWIVHNSIIYHENQSKLTSIARTFLKIARHEMTEIELCSECYLRSTQSITTDWFTKPCAIPHTLCWAKMKSYQPWPAKVLRIVNDEVDVRFFGQHDRAWIPLNNCFVLSKEYPGSEKKKSNINFEKSLIELQIHIDQLKKLYGHFTYAPPQTLLNKTKPFKFVSIIDDSILPSYITVTNSNQTFHSSIKHSKQQRYSTQNSSSESNKKKSVKRSNENSYDNQQLVKRQRVSSKHIDENLFSKEGHELQSTLNVFDILNQTKNDNEISSIPFKFRSISPTDNKLRIQALLRKYIKCKSPTINLITSDVRSSMNALLDSVETYESISDIHTNVNILPVKNQMLEQPYLPEEYMRIKKPRKSNLQHYIIPKNTNSNFITCSSLDESLSSSLPFVPLRPLSVSPSNVNSFESIPSEIHDNSITTQQKQSLTRTTSVEILNMKSEPIDQDEHQITQSSISLPTIMPDFHCTSQIATTIIPKNIYSSTLSIIPSTQQSKNPTHRRLESSIDSLTSSNSFLMNSPLQKQSINTRQSHHISNTLPISNQDSIRIPQYTNQVLLDDHQIRDEIQMIINSFNDQFQQLLVDLTSKIELSLQTTRMKYEKNLEETRRSYRISLNELHTITTEQIQEIHNSLELQYWKRLSEMRNRYESKLRYE